jgi:ribosomal protein S18 acetylase RimI-like enzyme
MTLELEPPPGVALRAAQPDDYPFAWKLYIESTEPLLKALGRWDEAAVSERFKNGFRKYRSHLICRDYQQIGWLQVSQNGTSLHLHQLHLVKEYRNGGIGSQLIHAAMAVATSQGLAVTLNVIRGNPAIALYRRLGFRVIGEDQELLRMRWDPPGD